MLYRKDKEHQTFLTDLMEGPFSMFLGVVGEKTLQNCLIDSFKAEFGEDMIQRDGKGSKVFFLVEPKFWLEEAHYVTPMDSQEFDHVDRLDQFLSGSKVAFRRQVIPGKHIFHTGILLRGKPNEPNAILEVNDTGPNDEETTLHLASAYSVYCKGSNPDGPTISIKGEHLHLRGLDMPKILYRYSRIANLLVCYSFTTLNCDVVANWLQRGTPQWITKTPESSLAYIIDFFRSAEDGVVTLATLYNIDAENSRLSN